MKRRLKTKLQLLLLMIIFISSLKAVTISGFVSNAENGERIPYISVVIRGTNLGVFTNKEGYFIINSVPTGKIEIAFSNIAFKQLIITEMVKDELDNKFLKVELEKFTIKMEGISVYAEKYKEEINSREIIVSNVLRTTEDLQAIPQIADSDVFRAIQVLPGVSALSDFSSGLYIRGGSPDQNLILLDEIDVYNPNHFGGIFSTFNTDAIENVELLKGGFPAKYGGRLSSVLDVTNLDGNRKSHQGVARLSLVSANSTLQGPWRIGNQKGSYMASFRRTYLEVLKNAFDLPNYYFYDGHAKLNWDVTEKDKFTVSSYFGKDRLEFNFGFNMLIEWGNETLSSQWVHIFNPQLFSKFVLAGSHFNSLFDVKYDSDVEYIRSNDIYDLTFKNLFSYTPNDQHMIDFGFEVKYNNITFIYEVKNSDIDPESLPDVEVDSGIFSAFFQDSWDLSDFWTIQPGLRLTFCHSESPNLPASPVGDYFRVSPRFSIRRKLTELSNVYFNYGRYFQYLTSMNPGMITPMDLWFPLDGSVKPGVSDHFILGYKTQIGNDFAFDVETYYKSYDNLVEFRPETDFEWNNQTGTLSDVYNMGDGYSYGTDVLFRTEWKGLEGFFGYSFGITQRKINSTNINPETGEEEPYHPRYERIHQINIVQTYNLTENTGFKILGSDFKIGTTYSYGSGQPYLKPEKAFYDEQGIHFLYSYKDRIRLPLYSRLDLSLKFKWQYSKWSLEPYLQIINLFEHDNVWSREYTYEEDDEGDMIMKGHDTSMFPRIPFIGFNIEW